MFKEKKQKGVSIYLIFMIMTIILGVSLALSSLVFIRFRVVARSGGAVTAFYAADAGAEELLYDINKGTVQCEIADAGFSTWAGITSHYGVTTTCRADYSDCPGCAATLECDAPRFCILSQGFYDGTQRAVRVKY